MVRNLTLEQIPEISSITLEKHSLSEPKIHNGYIKINSDKTQLQIYSEKAFSVWGNCS